MKRVFSIVLFCFCVVSISYGITKIYCDRCGVEMKGDLKEFSIDIKVGEYHQEIGADICDKCFEKMVKDLQKYNLVISSGGWKKNSSSVIYEPPKIAPSFPYLYNNLDLKAIPN